MPAPHPYTLELAPRLVEVLTLPSLIPWPKILVFGLSVGGGNFVDMTLEVVVKQDAGTMFAFDPTFWHGTTRLCGGHNHTITIAFSEHILDAFKKVQEGVSVEAGEGAGDGNCP
ncbi:hypothetical protein B0H13DRAFT_1922699 [Mycena leptocephala]|nr:hypothetical protein B0H13DRAFT_1922699 [Mycena leptocephala]